MSAWSDTNNITNECLVCLVTKRRQGATSEPLTTKMGVAMYPGSGPLTRATTCDLSDHHDESPSRSTAKPPRVPDYARMSLQSIHRNIKMQVAAKELIGEGGCLMARPTFWHYTRGSVCSAGHPKSSSIRVRPTGLEYFGLDFYN